jgi:hypothetical protein
LRRAVPGAGEIADLQACALGLPTEDRIGCVISEAERAQIAA